MIPPYDQRMLFYLVGLIIYDAWDPHLRSNGAGGVASYEEAL
jgi:hypothetical protein